jgi:hypothetical protein
METFATRFLAMWMAMKPVTEGTVHRHLRLGGLLNFYHRRKRRAAS